MTKRPLRPRAQPLAPFPSLAVGLFVAGGALTGAMVACGPPLRLAGAPIPTYHHETLDAGDASPETQADASSIDAGSSPIVPVNDQPTAGVPPPVQPPSK